MYKVLLVEVNEDFQKLFALNLNAYVGAETYFCKDSNEAISFIETDEVGIQVVITRNQIENDASADSIYSYLIGSDQNIPLICIGPSDIQGPNFFEVLNEDWREVIREAAKRLEVTSQSMVDAHKNLDDLYPIKVDYLSALDIDECATDVYIEKNGKYDIIIEEGEPFPSIILDELINDKTEHLFIEKDLRLKFVDQFSDKLLEKLNDEDLDSGEKISIGQIGFNTVSECLNMSGMSPKTIQLAQASVENMVGIVKKDNDLTSLLDELKANSSGYLYQHAILTSAICSRIVYQLDWASQDHNHKICFIALFHDIVLQTDKQAMINSSEDLANSDLTEQEKALVENHAAKAAKLVKNSHICPYGADNIILQHHGKMNGIGFAEGLNNSLSQLTIVFLVAEDFADQLLSIEKEFYNKENVMEGLKKKYNKGMYKKIVEILETL